MIPAGFGRAFRLVLIALGVLAGALLSAARAQEGGVTLVLNLACGPLPALLSELGRQRGELVVMTSEIDGAAVFMTRAPAGGWSIVLARDGKGCVAFQGDVSQLVGEL